MEMGVEGVLCPHIRLRPPSFPFPAPFPTTMASSDFTSFIEGTLIKHTIGAHVATGRITSVSEDACDVLLVVEHLDEVFETLYDFVRAHYRHRKVLMPQGLDVWNTCLFLKSGKWLPCSEHRVSDKDATESDSDSDSDFEDYESDYEPEESEGSEDEEDSDYEPEESEDTEETEDENDSDYEPEESEDSDTEDEEDSDYVPEEDSDSDTASTVTIPHRIEFPMSAPGAPRKDHRKDPRPPMFNTYEDSTMRITIQEFNDNYNQKIQEVSTQSEEPPCWCMMCEADRIPTAELPSQPSAVQPPPVPAEKPIEEPIEKPIESPIESPISPAILIIRQLTVRIYWSSDHQQWRVSTRDTSTGAGADFQYREVYLITLFDHMTMDQHPDYLVEVRIPCFPTLHIKPACLSRILLMKSLNFYMSLSK